MLTFLSVRLAPFALATLMAVLLVDSGIVAQSAYPAARHGGNYMHNFYFPPAPSSTPWAPAWSPDGRSIAVAMNGSIWQIDRENGAASQLTYNDKYHSLPAWSPDGRWLLYTADDGGATIQLELLDLETGETRQLTDDEHVYTDPVFSPSGDAVAYVSTRPNGYFNVFVRAFRGGEWAGPEIAITRDNDFGRSRLYFGRWDMHITPAWMPDGNELLLVSNRDQPLGSGNVLRVPVQENGIAAAEVVLAEQTLYRTRPHVSIDGKRFVYSSTSGAADQFNNLYVQPTEGGEPYKLTFFTHDAFHPRWSPNGEWIAYVTNQGGLPHLALLETYGGAQQMLPVTSRRWKHATGTLALRVVDDESGRLTAARIHLTASDGKFYAPFDAYARVGWAGDHAFHTEGEAQVVIPTGPVRITAVKGFEFWPESTTVEISVDGVTDVTLRLRRMTNMASRGWYNGSTHVHMNYGGNLHNTLANLMMMSDAEDQDIVNEQIANKDNRILDYQFFVPGGTAHPISRSDRLMVVGQEYRPPFYGHVFMLGLRDHLISPFVTGYEATAIESLYPSNTDMLRKAKAQGATVGYVHPFSGDSDPLDGDLGGAKGFIVDAALGATDALEWSLASRAGFFPLYAVWNNGLRVTATGGEDSITDLQRSKLIGSIRTYVCTDDRGLDVDSWFENLRAGRAFVSNGPLIDLRANGAGPGQDIALLDEGETVDVFVSVQSIVPLDKAFLVFNGETIEEIPLADDRRTAQYRASFVVHASGWLHVRVEGSPERRFPLDVEYAQAFTNPVWITVGNELIRNGPAAEYGLQWIDKLSALAAAWPGWRSQTEIDHVMDQFADARRVYEQFRVDAASTTRPSTLLSRIGAVNVEPLPATRSCADRM